MNRFHCANKISYLKQFVINWRYFAYADFRELGMKYGCNDFSKFSLPIVIVNVNLLELFPIIHMNIYLARQLLVD